MHLLRSLLLVLFWSHSCFPCLTFSQSQPSGRKHHGAFSLSCAEVTAVRKPRKPSAPPSSPPAPRPASTGRRGPGAPQPPPLGQGMPGGEISYRADNFQLDWFYFLYQASRKQTDKTKDTKLMTHEFCQLTLSNSG